MIIPNICRNKNVPNHQPANLSTAPGVFFPKNGLQRLQSSGSASHAETTFADGMDGMDQPPTKEIIEVYSCGNHLLGENLKIRGLWYSSTTATHKFTLW